MSKIGIGIIGYGEFAEFSHQSWKRLEGAEVIAASDVRRERVPDELTFYADWKELIADDRVHIITIGTPPSTHQEMALAALRAGKYVFVEKPPSLTYPGALEMLEEAGKADRLVVVDYMIRYNPIAEALKTINDEGILGKLQHVSVSNYAYDGKLGPEHWFWKKEVSGGILVEHAVHFFDLITFIDPGASPKLVTAHAVERVPGMEDKVEASVVYDNGLLATHYHHFFRPWWFERQTFRFAFDLGEVDVEGWIPLSAELRALVNPATKARLEQIFKGSEFDYEDLDVTEVTAGGANYQVNEMMDLFYIIQRPKMELYSDLVLWAMEPLVKRAQGDQSSTPRTELSTVIDSIKIADAATEFAQKQGWDSIES